MPGLNQHFCINTYVLYELEYSRKFSLMQEFKDTKLQIIERGITLLKSHIESFKKRQVIRILCYILSIRST